MNKEFIHTEQVLLDFIALPEVNLCSLKFCINEQNKQIDLECVLPMAKGCSVKISSSFR